MGNYDFIARSVKTSLIIGAIAFVFLSQRFPLQVLWGGTLGVMLGVLNLYLLSRLSEMLHHKGQRALRKRGLLLYAALKFPFFYGLLVFLLYQFQFSIISFMIGFSVPLFVIILKTYGGFVGQRASIIRST